MTEFALVTNNQLLEVRNYSERPPHIPHKNFYWYPLKREEGETFSGLIDDFWVIKTPPPPIEIPSVISPRQVRLLLLRKNMLEEVENMISEQDEATKITWQYATEFYRDDPLLNNLASNMGLSEEQINEFFIEASTI